MPRTSSAACPGERRARSPGFSSAPAAGVSSSAGGTYHLCEQESNIARSEQPIGTNSMFRGDRRGRRVRLTPPRAHSSELPVWKAAAILLSALALLVAFEIGLAFLVAYLVTGRAY